MRSLAMLSLSLAVAAPQVAAATFWTGPTVQFTKAAFADPALPENQDRLTASVWLTRTSTRGLYNAALESEYVDAVSPANTEWAPGSIADGVGTLTFTDWQTAVNNNPPGSLNQPFVLHILDEDIYVDVTFLAWQRGQTTPGGGFSYVRTSPVVTPPAEALQVPLAGPWALAPLALLIVVFRLRR